MKKRIVMLVLAGSALLTACSNDSSQVAAQITTANQELAALQQQVHALQAEAEIRHKLQTYMAVLNASDWDEYVNYFTRDGKIIMAEGTRTGRDDIKERMSTAAVRLAAAAANRPPRKSRDLLSNVEVEITGETTAKAKSRFIFLAENGDGGFEVTGSGLYIDEWALEEGEWRIAARVVDYDLLRLPTPPQQPLIPAQTTAPKP